MGRLEQRKRNCNQRKTKSIIAIGCEGKNKTETTYLKNFSSRECIIKFSTGRHTDPVGMANDLVDFIKSEDIKTEYGDKIYLLIDTDVNQNKQDQINVTKEICNQNNIELITSTPTFEYWYILHYGYTSKNYQSSKQVKNEIKNKISNYSESMNVYPIIENKTDIAIVNAKKIEKYQEENGQDIDSEEANPHTSAYRVIEELKKRRRYYYENN
ncbi:MAG: RloB family protein [Clostridia bacterium]